MSARSQSPRRPSGPAPDVIVIGGGIVGVSAAAELAATGRRVVLLERTAVAAGASGRNSGVVQHPFDPVLVDLHLETLRLYRALDEDAGSGKRFALPAEPVGLLLVTHDPAVARRSADDLVATHPGLVPTYLDPDDVRALEPSVGPGVSACRVAIGYPVGPAAATHAWAARAARLGVDIRIGEAARPWLASGRVAGVELEDGERIADGAGGRRRGTVDARRDRSRRRLAADPVLVGRHRRGRPGRSTDPRPRGGGHRHRARDRAGRS